MLANICVNFFLCVKLDNRTPDSWVPALPDKVVGTGRVSAEASPCVRICQIPPDEMHNGLAYSRPLSVRVPSVLVCAGGRCVLCKRVRPARAHHCSGKDTTRRSPTPSTLANTCEGGACACVACGCCQLRRDHHCYWSDTRARAGCWLAASGGVVSTVRCGGTGSATVWATSTTPTWSVWPAGMRC